MNEHIGKVQQLKQASWAKNIEWWIKDNNIVTERRLPFEFTNHGFLRDIINDWHPVQTGRKAAQVGWTTAMILKTMYAARYRGWNIIYTLPTFNDIGEFASKINPIIENNPILGEWTKDKNTTFQKKIGDRFIYYRGTSSNKEQKKKMESGTGIMLTSDLNVHDESDRSDQVIMEQYESRGEASEYKGRWYFSNPTVPKTLTQDLWEISDQKHWFIKCPHCGFLQWLDYFKNIDKIAGIFMCQKCFKEIDDDTRRAGFWVKKYRDRTNVSGYWIPHMICPWITAKELIESERTKSKQYFYNFRLGLPYRGTDVVVDKTVILKNLVHGEPNFKTKNVMGVDTGIIQHYVLGNEQGIFKIGKGDWKTVERLMKTYEVVSVFDALGDLTKPRKLKDKYMGKVWLSYFKKDKDSPKTIRWDDDEMAVYADRSKIIQRVVDEFVDGKIKFYEMGPEDLREYIEHWETASQVVEKDTLGIERKVWQTEGNNHLLMATIYFYLALLRAGEGEILDDEGGRSLYPKAHDAQSPSPKEEAKKMAEGEGDWRA